ncbi:MAG: DUF4837 family protein [Bacteroidales bacterium]|nr:DUF4837 family protein [Bacteroidales bacterium]
MRALFLTLILAFSLNACTYEKSTKPYSGGKTLEVLVVCDKSDFTSAVGDTLRAFFMRPDLALNQAEPLFSLANVPLSTFENTDMFRRMRNIILIIFTPDKSPKFSVRQDVWATNQVVFQFDVPNREAFFTLFQEKRDLMMQAFYSRERARIIRTFRTAENVAISERLLKTFGFRLVAPEGFRILTSTPDFVSINKEAKDYGQNLMVHTYPYTANSFKQSDILRVRNEIARKHIFGPLEGSYMTTETLVPPISTEVNLNGRYAIETRGLWKLVGDFMGGPFINYVFLDEERNQMVMIDAFLYSPKKGKRDLLMQLEAIVYSIDRIEN